MGFRGSRVQIPPLRREISNSSFSGHSSGHSPPRITEAFVFLSKRSHGVYYLYYLDDLGKRHKVSTHCKRKSDALKFIQQYKLSEGQKKAKLQRVLLSQFGESFLSHSRNIHRPKTQESIRTSLREFQRVVGDLPLHKIGVREVEKFVVMIDCLTVFDCRRLDKL